VQTEHARRMLNYQALRVVPISAVLEHYGVLGSLKRQGIGTLKGPCPIHKGDGRSFVVDENKGLWNCFSPSCKRGGDILNLVAELENVDIRHAAQLIARWFAIGTSNQVHSQQQHRKPKERAMSGEKPSHGIYVVEGEGDSAFWHRVGSAWPHKDGKGLNLQIPAGMAISGRVALRELTAKDEEEDNKSKRKK
jgi:hypothetical protein